MKKDKAKLENKKAKKELTDKLVAAFTLIVADYGKVKKSKAIIEKFAKQLSKKIDLQSKVEVVVETPAPVEETVVKAKPVKKVKEIVKDK
jgi:hypothetical protein